MGIKGAIFILILAIGCGYLFQFLAMHGVDVHYIDHYPGQCRQVPGIQCGSEQISVTKDGLAFITNGFKGFTNCNPKYTPGRIYLFHFNHPERNSVPLEIDSPSLDPISFDPHGMDILDNGGELIKIFVVNHANQQETVEKFEFNRNESTRLRHVGTIRDEKFICINDLVLLSENEFFITNCLKTCGYPLFITVFEVFLQLPTGNVVHYINGNSTVVATASGMNGVTLSKDKNKLLVASSQTVYMHVYDILRVGDVLQLKLNQVVHIGHFSDNIQRDEEISGNVFLIGVHKQTYKMVSYIKNRTSAISGSAVRVFFNDDWSTVNVEEILHDNGWNLVKAVTVAVHYKKQYLFGTISDKLAYCVED